SSTSETESSTSEEPSSDSKSDNSSSEAGGKPTGNSKSTQLSGGAIAGIVVGIVAFVMILVGAIIVWIHKKRKMQQAIRDVNYSEYPEFDFSQPATHVTQTRPPETMYMPPPQPQPQPQQPQPQPPQHQPYNYSNGHMANQQLYTSPSVPQWPQQQPGGFHIANTAQPQPPSFMRNLDNP
ncbi:hypothetical protein GGH18_002837, partial [Coemansia sp. RSA 530]